jgi:hypothetical protein
MQEQCQNATGMPSFPESARAGRRNIPRFFLAAFKDPDCHRTIARLQKRWEPFGFRGAESLQWDSPVRRAGS